MDYSEELGEKKIAFLKLSNEKVRGNKAAKFNFKDVGKELLLPDEELFNIVAYLIEKGLIAQLLGTNYAQITQPGIDVAENNSQLSGKDLTQITQNITNSFQNSGSISNSQFMQGSISSSQSLSISQKQVDDLKKFIEAFEQKYSEIKFHSIEDKQEAIAEVSTIKAQLDSPKPKWEIIKSAGNTVKGVLEKAAAMELVEYLKDLF